MAHPHFHVGGATATLSYTLIYKQTKPIWKTSKRGKPSTTRRPDKDAEPKDKGYIYIYIYIYWLETEMKLGKINY